MEIQKEIQNKVLKRTEIEAVVESDKNPSFPEIKSQVSKHSGKPEENVDVLNVIGSFGKNKFKIIAHVYDKKEDLEKSLEMRMTQKKKEEIKKAEEARKKAEAEAAKAEAEQKPAE